MEPFELKKISADSISAALEKAEKYRAINDPADAESICDDVLGVDPSHQRAMVMLVLSLTDQFASGGLTTCYERARSTASQIEDSFDRHYYSGIVCERRAKAHLCGSAPARGTIAHPWFVDAMEWFEKAQELSPAGNDNAVLRWNACARIMMRHPEIQPAADDDRDMPAMLE